MGFLPGLRIFRHIFNLKPIFMKCQHHLKGLSLLLLTFFSSPFLPKIVNIRLYRQNGQGYDGKNADRMAEFLP